MKPEPTEAASLDEPPVAALYDRYAAIIFAYLSRHCASREDAEDVLLDVFVAALEYRKLTDVPEARRLPWLQRVAQHKLVDYYRRSKRRSAVALEEVADVLEADEAQEPEQVALQQEAQDRVRAAIQRLPAQQQEVLRLRFVAGLRSMEIAQVLGKRDGAVRMLLSRALNLLRALYEEQKEGEDAMPQDQTPFTPEAVDTQVEALEVALQFEPSDHPKTVNMQVIAALHDVYAAERQAHNASLRQVRQHLLRQSRAAPQARPHLQESRAMPGIPSERRKVMNHPLRSFSWRGRLLTRFSTIAAALAVTLLVGGLIAGLILVRHGNGGTTQTGQDLSGGTEVRLQTACPIPNQQCTPYKPALLPTERAILEHRLQDALGSSSWTISLEGNNTLVVDLPPMAQTQEQATIGLLDQTGLLQILDTGAQSLPVNQPVPAGVTYPVPFTGQDLDTSSIQATLDPVSGQPVLLFEFKPQKRSAFASYTEAHIGEFLTIALDSIVIESAVIQSQITGQAEIAGGGRTLAQYQHIAVLLRSGPLLVPLTVVSTQPIS